MGIFGKNDLNLLTAGTQTAELINQNKFNSGTATGPLNYLYIYTSDINSKGPINVYMGLYSHDAVNSRPEFLLDYGSATLSLNAPFSWLQIPMTNNYVISNDTIYWIAIQFGGSNVSGDSFGWYRNTNYGVENIFVSELHTPEGFTNWPDPWTKNPTNPILLGVYAETGSLVVEEQSDRFSNAHIWTRDQIDITSAASIQVVESVNINSNASVYITDTNLIYTNASVQVVDSVNINSNASIEVKDSHVQFSNAVIIPVWPPTDYRQIESDATVWKRDTIILTSQAVILELPPVKKVEPRLRQVTPTPYQDDSGFKIF